MSYGIYYVAAKSVANKFPDLTMDVDCDVVKSNSLITDSIIAKTTNGALTLSGNGTALVQLLTDLDLNSHNITNGAQVTYTIVNRTGGDLTLKTTTSGNVVLNPVGSINFNN